MPLHHPRTVARPRKLSVRRFFEEIFPRVLAERSDICRALGGRYAFAVVSDFGSEAWILDFDRAEVTRNAEGPCALVVRAPERVYRDWLDGRLGFENVLIRGDVEVAGSPRALDALAAVLAP